MFRAVFSSLRMRLLVLVWAVFLPVFFLTLYGDYVERDLRIHEAKDNAYRLVSLAAADEERLMSSQSELVRAIARLDAVEGRDAVACNKLLADLMAQSDAVASVAVADLNGAVWCSSIPLPSSINIGDRSYFKRAVETRALTFSNYQIGRISGLPVINLTLPSYNSAGELQGVVSASLNLAWLNRSLGDMHLPSHSTLFIIDSDNTLLAFSPNPKWQIGRAITQTALIQAIQAQPEGGAIEFQEEGEPYLYVFTPLRGEAKTAGFFASIGIPTSVAYAAVGQNIAGNLLGLAVVTLLAMIAAWWFGELLIVRRLRIVTALARELAEGNLNVRTGRWYGVSELSELTHQFDRMAEKLQQRDGDLKRQAEELATITRLSREITQVPDLATTLDTIARLIAEAAQSDAVGVLMLGADGKLRQGSQALLIEP